MNTCSITCAKKMNALYLHSSFVLCSSGGHTINTFKTNMKIVPKAALFMGSKEGTGGWGSSFVIALVAVATKY